MISPLCRYCDQRATIAKYGVFKADREFRCWAHHDTTDALEQPKHTDVYEYETQAHVATEIGKESKRFWAAAKQRIQNA